MFSPTWRRPKDIGYPKTWSTFERKASDGAVLKFQVQDMTEDHYEEVFSIMEKYFLAEETFHTTAGISNPSAHARFMRGLAERIMLPQKLSLVCVLNRIGNTSNRCFQEQNSREGKVVGYNFLAVAKKDEKIDFTEWEKHETGNRFLAILRGFKSQCPDLLKKYDVQNYIGSLGLCIHPEYRGLKIAEEILKTRVILCKAIGVKLTFSTFTASASQKIAEKVGFVEEKSLKYEEAEEIVGFKFVTKQTHCKQMSYCLD